jgi:O-antigen/teichoic acid export membrane protein
MENKPVVIKVSGIGGILLALAAIALGFLFLGALLSVLAGMAVLYCLLTIYSWVADTLFPRRRFDSTRNTKSRHSDPSAWWRDELRKIR